MIRDLMVAVDRVEHRAEQQRVDQELHEIYTMQIPVIDGEQAYMGAA